MPVRTRLYLCRHCDVANPRKVLYGYLPGFGLSDKGLRQAEAMGRYLAGRPIRRIYTSPLERAEETSAILARHLDQVEVVPDPDLLEARFSLYLEGVPAKQVPWRRPLWWVHLVWPGLLRRDETVPGMAERIGRPLARLLADFPGESGACVSHGDPIQAFWIRHRGRPVWALHRLQCAKGGLLILDYDGTTLARITYMSPERIAAAAAPAAGTAPAAG
ncbi:MAG: histidine phosphatase family protein [Candidatus Dormibacteria bacterium]